MLSLVCPSTTCAKYLFLLLWLITTSVLQGTCMYLKVVNALIYPFRVVICIYIRVGGQWPLRTLGVIAYYRAALCTE